MSGVETVLISVFAAIVYSLSMFVKKALKSENPDSFDAVKFAVTVMWGALIGLYMAYSGIEITEQSVEAQFTAYAGLIALTENILKAGIRYFTKNVGGRQ